ncbi:MAG TPA: DUF1573 domain-containing protein, partial [Thermoanaerobaculia bacterium]|nr:DUF1573 domain-containing protein [Thermoanaerobaculia bacterium]
MSKRLFVLTLAVLMLAASVAIADEPVKGPRLTLVDPLKDFGTVAKGDKLEWAFQVKNTGTTDLEIIAAKPTCGCTVADFDKVIKPGATGKVSAHVDTTAFSGPINKAVTLETNDPTAPTAQVTITAVVKPFVEAYPAGFVRYNLLQGGVEKQTITLYSDETEPFQITKIESPQEWIKVEQKKNEGLDVIPNIGREGQNQYKIEVTVGGPDAKIGPLAEKIRVLTNSKHQPEYWVSVSGVVRPSIRVEPTALNFGEVAPSDVAATRTIMLRTNDLKTPETFQVVKAESNVQGVLVSLSPT